MNRNSRLARISTLLVFLSATAVNNAFAYGEPDPAYKPEGVFGTLCAGGVGAQAVVPDGSIYTAMNRPFNFQSLPGIVRHRAEGSIDKAWGNGGAVGLSESATRLLPAADGGLFAIGNHISRYQRNGTLDPLFGSTGVSDLIIPSGSNLATVALQSDGSIVSFTYSNAGRTFVRTNPRGIRDSNFGPGGTLSIPFTAVPNDVAIYAWSVEADGSVQPAWYQRKSGVPLQFQFELKRFRKGLSAADPTFDAGGRLVPRQGVADWLSPVAKVQADGALLLATQDCLDVACTEPVVSVRRYDALGNVDTGFGESGKTVFRVFPWDNDPRSYAFANALWLGTDGQLTVFIEGLRRFGSFGGTNIGTVVYRMNADGKLDTGFENGKQVVPDQSATFIQLDDGRLLRPGNVDGCAPLKYLTDTPRTAAVVVEYYSPTLDHYFMTAHEFEKDFVDRGLAGDWRRTGQVFGAFSIDAPMPGTSPVCRYYGGANGGPNSHFYSAEKFECDILARLEAQTPPDKPAWRFEREAFRITVPVAGNCPPISRPFTASTIAARS